MPEVLRAGRAAFTFLTIVPVGGFPYSDAAWRWSAAWFPFVGLCLGFAGAGVFTLLRPAGAGVAAVAALTLTVLLTGAFHEDGLADTADALGGAYDRERLFAILKDSRIGTYGAMALVTSFALRGASLASLDADAPQALVVAHMAARVTPVCLMAVMPYATSSDTSKSRPVVRGAGPQAIAAIVFASAALWAGVDQGLLPLALVGALALGLGVVALASGAYFRRRAGGITGDFLGATEQINEATILVTLAMW
ncbi:MAG: adenosylcobinamide-GDP ribazoletransferase [Myxococcota bacterium]